MVFVHFFSPMKGQIATATIPLAPLKQCSSGLINLSSSSSSSSSSFLIFIRYCPLSGDGRIHPSLPQLFALHLSILLDSSFLFKPIFSVFSSTYFFVVFFGRPCFLLPLTSKSRTTLKTLSSSLFSTCLCHLTPFAVANPFTVSFKPSMSICSLVVFLSITFRPQTALMIALSVLLKIVFSFSFKRHVLLPYPIADLTQQRWTFPFILGGNLLPSNNSPHFLNLTPPIFTFVDCRFTINIKI